MMMRRFLFVVLGVVTQASCVGAIGGSETGEGAANGGATTTGGTRAGATGPGAPAPGAAAPGSPGAIGSPTSPTTPGTGLGGADLFPAVLPASRPVAPLRRLSRAQYNNTIRDLLGDGSRPADAFLADESPGTFAGNATVARVSPTIVDQYRTAAERAAASAVKNLGTLLPCQPQPAQPASEETCAKSFIDDFGLRAYRRPLAPEEALSFLDVYRRMRAESDFAYAIKAVIAAALESPYFLYRVELPPPGAAAGTVAPFGPYEVASRLSFFFWNTMPDKELFAAAKAGKLSSAADIDAQAQRLMRDPRVRDVMGNEFFDSWLKLDMLDRVAKDPRLFKEFTDDLRRAMREETVRFSVATMFDGDGRLETLLTSTRSIINGPLGAIYGATGGTAFAPADLNPAQRAGVLTHASVMTLTADDVGTSPTKRGQFVRDQIMCQPPPPPPPNVDTMLPKPQPGQTVRERFKLHVANPACGSCHVLMDPVGFGFENYNAIGKYQTTDGTKPIDASGEIVSSLDIDGPFVGAVALAKKLAGSAQVRKCQAMQWFRFAHGRSEGDGDLASLKAMFDAYAASGSLRDLMLAVTKTEAFRSRLVEVAR